MPALTAEIADPCPAAEPLPDGSLATLARGDAALAFLYARCRAKHQAAVDAYNFTREALAKRAAKPKSR